MESTLKRKPVLRLTLCGLFVTLIVILSAFGIPVPYGKIFLCDAAIVMAALVLDPVSSMLTAGIGTCIADLMFFPSFMFVTLLVHGLQGYVISKIAHGKRKEVSLSLAIAGVICGIVILVSGYTLGKIWIYGSLEIALSTAPYELIQGLAGGIVGLFAAYGLRLKEILSRKIHG